MAENTSNIQESWLISCKFLQYFWLLIISQSCSKRPSNILSVLPTNSSDLTMKTYTKDKKYREVQTEIRKKQKKTDASSLMMGGEYVDAYRNISVAATGEQDLNKDLEDKGMSSKDKEATGPSAEMYHKLAKYQIKCGQDAI